MEYQRNAITFSQPGSNITRRRFLEYSLLGVAGFLAVKTLRKRLADEALPTSSTLELDVSSISKLAYIARPARLGAAAAVVILHDWWGLSGEVKRLADQFAAQGFIAVAPDLFSGRVANSVEEAKGILGDLNAADILRQLQSILKYTAQYEKVASENVTLIAANFGGRLAIALSQQTLKVGSIVILQGQSNVSSQVSDQTLNGNDRTQDEQLLINAHIMVSPLKDAQFKSAAQLGYSRLMAPTWVSGRSFGYMADSTSHKQFSHEWSRVAAWINRGM